MYFGEFQLIVLHTNLNNEHCANTYFSLNPLAPHVNRYTNGLKLMNALLDFVKKGLNVIEFTPQQVHCARPFGNLCCSNFIA